VLPRGAGTVGGSAYRVGVGGHATGDALALPAIRRLVGGEAGGVGGHALL
jgi:hypothetical protein